MAPGAPETPQDKPLERLKLLGGDDAEIAQFLDSIEVTSPREREMLYEISRTTPLAQVELFPQAHRNMAEALESLARHGYHGTRAGQRLGPLRVVVQWGVRLVARYLVVSHIRNLVKQIRNLYVMREIQSVVGTRERLALTRARSDAEQMLEALKTNEVAVPTFLISGALIPVVAALGRANGLLDSTAWATASRSAAWSSRSSPPGSSCGERLSLHGESGSRRAGRQGRSGMPWAGAATHRRIRRGRS